MTFEADLVAHLKGDSGIASAVAERIQPVIIPQDANAIFPRISYSRVTGTPSTDLDGLDGGLINVRLQIDCWARSHGVVRELAELVRLRLQTAAATFKSVTNFDQDLYEDDAKLFRVLLDVNCWYRSA